MLIKNCESVFVELQGKSLKLKSLIFHEVRFNSSYKIWYRDLRLGGDIHFHCDTCNSLVCYCAELLSKKNHVKCHALASKYIKLQVKQREGNS